MSDAPGGSLHPSHGNSPAAWTAVTIILIGSVVAGVAIIFDAWLWFWIGAVALPVFGLIVGKIMSNAGLGSTPVKRASQEDVAAAAIRAAEERSAGRASGEEGARSS